MKKSIKRTAAILVVVILSQLWPGGIAHAAVLSTGTSSGVQVFSDLAESNWAYESIEEMSARGIIAGYPDKTFRSEKTVTYGELIKMVSIMADGKDTGNAPGEEWAANYYSKLLEKGYYTSFDIPEVKMNWTIPRGDMALVISGLIKEEAVTDFNQVETRIGDIGADTKNQVEIVKAYAAGILKGYPDRTFRPEGKLSRGEAAAALYRVIQRKAETDIFSYINNMEDYRKDVWIETGNYRIVTPHEAEIKLRVAWNGRIAGFDHTMLGFIYLVKDYKIIEYCRSIPAETFITTASHFELDYFDYILCIPSKHGAQTQSLLVANPFKNKVNPDE